MHCIAYTLMKRGKISYFKQKKNEKRNERKIMPDESSKNHN